MRETILELDGGYRIASLLRPDGGAGLPVFVHGFGSAKVRFRHAFTDPPPS